ncbi:MAG: hypothetical protein IKV48_00575, partial [Eggerthellaceae bacterium]|nr:hypothetical protein [Eggerthellaceae bacterium]
FVRSYRAFGKKKRGSLYQLVDNYTLFYYKFLEGGNSDERYWENSAGSGGRSAWCGLAFERVCLEHVPQIKRALGISGVITEVGAWSCKADPDNGVYGSQVDLLIDRRDQIVNLCEMKFAADDFTITKDVEESLRHKVSDFKALAKTRSAVHVTLVTTYGVKEGKYSGAVQSVVTSDDLFS